jgi:predicted branched-subunit amino acid permease
MSFETMRAAPLPGEFLQGVTASLPVIIGAAPFGLLFGALAVENGLSVPEAVLMSATVYGGASQMVGIELFGQTVAPWLIVLSIFAVNFRHVLYSGAIGRRIRSWPAARQALGFFFLVDPQYAEAEVKGQRGEAISFLWYMGMALPIYVLWVATSWLGAAFGALIPDPAALGIDFLLPLYFFGLVMEFRERKPWLPVVALSAAASIAAYHLVGSPWHVSIGAAAGILFAVMRPAGAGGDDR